MSTFVAVVMTMSAAAAAWAQAPVTPGLPPPQVVPPTQGAQPAVPPQTVPVAPAPAAAAPPAVLLTRTFTAKSGLLFNTVRPERVKDFETVMWYLQQALEKSTDPTVRAQAQGWKIFRSLDPGPNATALYVFVLDPAVPGADYGLGRILADAYPEQIQEIWKLYMGSVTGGGTIVNLNPVEPMPPMPLVPLTAPDPTTVPGSRTPPPPPPASTIP
ncbi:MAG TPA: hypothetical protein VIX63_13410 [Vicinamibacterales bacterium]